MKRRMICSESSVVKKLLLVGDPGVGKTAFVKRLLGLNDTEHYHPSLGINIYQLHYPERGIKFDIWDVGANNYIFGNDCYLSDQYNDADFCIIMVDEYTSRKNTFFLYSKVRQVCGNEIPIIIVYNKDDHGSERSNQYYVGECPLPRFDISVRNSYQCEVPIFYFIDTYL